MDNVAEKIKKMTRKHEERLDQCINIQMINLLIHESIERTQTDKSFELVNYNKLI